MHSQQLDIFSHSRDVELSNGVVAALERREPLGARAALQEFSAEFPVHSSLTALGTLVAALEMHRENPFMAHEVACEAHLSLAETVEPAALRIFGVSAGSAWLIPLWRSLAQQSVHLPFRPEWSSDHAAALWLRATDWAEAIAAIGRIESWRRIPASLAWMAQAQFRLHDLDRAWGLLAELAWLSCERFDQLAKQLADPVLQRLRQHFDASFDGYGDLRDLAWFPAWVLTEVPALSGQLSQALPGLQTDPERAMRLMLELLGLERQGRHRDVVLRRKELRDINGALFAAYMKTR